MEQDVQGSELGTDGDQAVRGTGDIRRPGGSE